MCNHVDICHRDDDENDDNDDGDDDDDDDQYECAASTPVLL